MKTNPYILSFRQWILILGIGILISGCEIKEEPVQNIYKAKPVDKAPNVKPEEEKLNKEIHPSSTDSIHSDDTITPVDSTSKNIQDTTETMHREKKPAARPYKKLYLYNLHKKALIS